MRLTKHKIDTRTHTHTRRIYIRTHILYATHTIRYIYLIHLQEINAQNAESKASEAHIQQNKLISFQTYYKIGYLKVVSRTRTHTPD